MLITCIMASNCIGDHLPTSLPSLPDLVKSMIRTYVVYFILPYFVLPDMLIFVTISERLSFRGTSREDELAQDKPRSGE